MKKEQIIIAARKLFHQFGFKKVSMDEIAKEAKVTKKTIYMYFKSKEELLKYFIEEEIGHMKKIVEEVEGEELDFFDKVNQAVFRLLQYKKQRDFLKIISKEAEWFQNAIVIENLKRVDEQIQNYIKEKLKIAKEKGYITYEDLEITAFLIYKMYLALILEWNDEEKKLEEQKIAKTMTEILKNGLKKEKKRKEEKKK